MTFAVIYILAAVLFMLLLITLGFKPKFISRITGTILLFVAVCGMGVYGYGYYVLYGGTLRTVVRTLFSVFCMFLGRNEISAISAVPLLATDGMQILIYAIHLLALYCTASAVLVGIGSNMIRTLNLLLVHRGDLNLVYGVNADTVDFAEQLVKENVTVMVDAGGGEAFASQVMHMECLMLNDDAAKGPAPSLLRKLGIRPGKRHFYFYCLSADNEKNMRYAAALRDILQARGIEPSQTTLTVLTNDAAVGETLQASEECYGYGSVLAVNRPELIARMLTTYYPPYKSMLFDTETGRATEDFECIVIGFGATGQAVLRSLLMNAQFAGSEFKATVVAMKYTELSGPFFSRYPALEEKYKIEFIDDNARSVSFYNRLNECCRRLNYVAVCTGSPKENAEITRDLTAFLSSRGCSFPVVQCSVQGISKLDEATGLPQISSLFNVDVLHAGRMDAMAKVLNHQYHLSEGRTVDEDWADCDYFSRISCRASADFLDVFLTASGATREQAMDGSWQPSAEVMENLGEMEHKRWCAFHYCMGFRPMPEDVFDDRAMQYKKQLAAGEKPLRITKDMSAKMHACLVDWDELDALAEREEKITGTKKDYKAMDLDNVRMIPHMLKEVSHE
ncbi:MAG: hypothetical protein J5865_07050 [Lachnospiraceae bacterium]|nr:hypothetical protein [Lachnospiraceae bacterium]